MRRYILYMVGLVLSVATIGCVKSDGTSANQSGMMTLQLSNGTLTTRAVGTNDDTNHEDLIANAQVFFFESDAVNATVQHSYYTSIGQNQQASMSIPLSANQLTTLFPNNKSYVYVIANYGSEITGATTLAALKEKTITSTFGTDADGVQDSFIMDSELVEVTRGDANTITGEVFLTRAAAKVELTVKVKSLTQDGKTWVADTNNMKVSFKNGVNKGLIDDGSDTDDTSDDKNADLASADYFSTSARGFTAVENVADSYVQSVPFYSYSTKWTAGADNEVYLELAIPWKVQEQSASESEAGADSENVSKLTYQTFYYQVPVSVDDLSLVRNAYYKLTLDVGVLGGLTEPVTVEPSYVVIDWGTNEVNVDLSRPKYLVVNENKVDVFNQNTYSIGYQSSDAISVKIVSLTRDDLSTNTAGTTTYHSSTAAGVTSVNAGQQDTANKYKLLKTCSVSVENGQIVFSHDLVNEDENRNVDADGYTLAGQNYRNIDDYDFAPYYITLLVEMKVDNSTTFREIITITQYPQMYIKAYQNSDYADGNTNHNGDHNVMVNAISTEGYTVNTGQASFGSVSGFNANNTNANPNMYVITTTRFSSDSDFFIGDPRQSANDTSLINETHDGGNSIWVNTKALGSTTNRKLMYYYPTVRDMTGSDNTNPAHFATGNMVAPQIRVASSYSVTSGPLSSIDAAEKRCAAYQEDGFPAGRWRLPTYAEAAFIVSLSNELKIPRLFSNGYYYWCAHGEFLPSTTGVTLRNVNNPTAYSVRCVYDEWYWGSEQLPENQRGTFTWGDEPR